MKYFTQSVMNHIVNKAIRFQESGSMGHRIIIMIPAMPEKYLISIADALKSQLLKHTSTILTLKFAQVLTDKWSPQGKRKAADHGWLDERGNLTYYRNLAPREDKLSLVVLCGADQGTDTASLADFYYCDLDMIWQNEMHRSFKDWVLAKLNSIGIETVSHEDIKIFDNLIIPIMDVGRSNLLQISDWLEELDLSQTTDVMQIQKIMLEKMGQFGLPSFIGYSLRKNAKSFASYIIKAGDFFNYSTFLETRERDKAIKTIDRLNEHLKDGEDIDFMLDDSIYGPYLKSIDFLDGLREYILNDNKEHRQKLLMCDFVTVVDKILKYREPATPGNKDSVRKINGSPIEMILTSLWLSLHDFYRNTSFQGQSEIESIEIRYTQFKHDIEGFEDEENGSTSDNTSLARDYLIRLLGSIESILTKRIEVRNLMKHEIDIKFSSLDEIACQHSRTAEPQVEFTVYIYCTGESVPYHRKFAWRLPEHHSYRLADALLIRAKSAMDNCRGNWNLPVFHLRYYEELLKATSADEIRRVFLYSIRDAHDEDNFLTNLLSTDWLEIDDILLPKLKALASNYHFFIKEAVKKGLLGALFEGGAWTDLLKAYSAAFLEATESSQGIQSPTAGMLLRSFLIIQQSDYGTSTAWHSNPFEPSGIVTVLHPALLEMIEAQIVYIITCFNYLVNKEIQCDSRKGAFNLHRWRTYTDLAEIQAPLTGLLHNEDQNLDTNIRGQELIHRLGLKTSGEATISTRLIINYGDTVEDEDVSDAEMFSESNESKHLLRLLIDYLKLHPHAKDGLSLAIFRNKDIQPVIAAIHHYLFKLANPRDPNLFILRPERSRPYSLSVTIFSDSSDDVDVSSWIMHWKERWEAAESESLFQPYRVCKFNVAHRLVERGRMDLFQKLINDNFEADIAVFYDFIDMGSGVNKFENVQKLVFTDRTLKFPILEKACCTINNPADKFKRSRVISNRQFRLGAQHANLRNIQMLWIRKKRTHCIMRHFLKLH